DGKIDLRNSQADAIGSVANFLAQHGWQRGEPLVFPATVDSRDPADGNDDIRSNPWQAFIGQGLEAKFSVDALKAGGVRPGIEPPADMMFGLWICRMDSNRPNTGWVETISSPS